MTAPTPLNRSERRRTKDKALAPENALFRLALLSRREHTGDDGRVYAQSYFQLVAPNGVPLCEQEPGGEAMPVIIASVAQPVRRSLIARA